LLQKTEGAIKKTETQASVPENLIYEAIKNEQSRDTGNPNNPVVIFKIILENKVALSAVAAILDN